MHSWKWLQKNEKNMYKPERGVNVSIWIHNTYNVFDDVLKKDSVSKANNCWIENIIKKKQKKKK